MGGLREPHNSKNKLGKDKEKKPQHQPCLIHIKTQKTPNSENKQTIKRKKKKEQKVNLAWDRVLTAALEGDQAVGELKERAPSC